MKNTLAIAAMALTFGLVMAYHDTAVFQDSMEFLFSPPPSMAAPLFWQEYRLWFLGGLFLLLVACYIPVWVSARSLIRIYRDSPANPERPGLSALQAGFLYSRSQSDSMAVWLIERCLEGSLALHCDLGRYYAWSVTRGQGTERLSDADAELMGMIFERKETVLLRPALSDSNPPVRDASARLFRRVRSANEGYFKPRRSSFLAWLIFVALLAEIPSYNALDQNQPGMIALALFCAAAFAVPFYSACRQLPSLVTGSIGAMILVSASAAFALVVPLIVFSGKGQHYMAIGLLPALVAAVAVSVYRLPLALKDESLLPKIIGYRRALGQANSPYEEEDIAWHLALGVHTDIVDTSSGYARENLPAWLTSSEDDAQGVMRSLHQTLPRSVTKAIYGEKTSRRSRTGGGGVSRRY